MKTQSAKAKGRRLQQWIRDVLIEKLNIHPEDIESRSMGAGGEDLIMARAARELFPYSVECKNQEKINVWESYKQADDNSKDYEPIVVLKRNNTKHHGRGERRGIGGKGGWGRDIGVWEDNLHTYDFFLCLLALCP